MKREQEFGDAREVTTVEAEDESPERLQVSGGEDDEGHHCNCPHWEVEDSADVAMEHSRDAEEVDTDGGGDDAGSNNSHGVAYPKVGNEDDGKEEEEDNDTDNLVAVEKHAISSPKKPTKELPVVLRVSMKLLTLLWTMVVALAMY